MNEMAHYLSCISISHLNGSRMFWSFWHSAKPLRFLLFKVSCAVNCFWIDKLTFISFTEKVFIRFILTFGFRIRPFRFAKPLCNYGNVIWNLVPRLHMQSSILCFLICSILPLPKNLSFFDSCQLALSSLWSVIKEVELRVPTVSNKTGWVRRRRTIFRHIHGSVVATHQKTTEGQKSTNAHYIFLTYLLLGLFEKLSNFNKIHSIDLSNFWLLQQCKTFPPIYVNDWSND